MSPKDRTLNLLFIAASLCAWVVVATVVTTTYPRSNPSAGLLGAGAIGLAVGLLSVPVFWLIAFARHRRIALLGDWGRAMRRGAWVGGTAALFVSLRIQEGLSVPLALFVVVMVRLAETALSVER
jgi:hypothetical protein